MTYRFLGTESNVGGVGLSRFGQGIDLSDDEAKQLILGGGAEGGFAGATPIISDADFRSCGFSDSELRDFAFPGAQFKAPPEFLRKKALALEKLHAYRVSLIETRAETEGEEIT